MDKIGIIIQARMGSQRLPGKILKKIGKKNLLEHIIYRLSFLRHEAITVVATSHLQDNDVVEAFCKTNHIDCFRGSEENVLERYYFCAKQYGFNHIVRLTADNPFVDIEELDNLIDLHINKKADYSHSFGDLPVGVGSEIFSFIALKTSHENGTAQNHREHVNEYIQENPDSFKVERLEISERKKRPEAWLTIDTEEDYERASFIIQNCCHEFVTTKEAIELCSQFA